MERPKVTQAKVFAVVRHPKRKSEQLPSKENSFCTSRTSTASNSMIKAAVIIKNMIHRPKSGNASINLDLSKIQEVKIPGNTNYSARNLEHRRANSIYLCQKGKGSEGGTDRSRRGSLSAGRLPSAPEIVVNGNSRFVERLGLAEHKLNYFYNYQKK